MSRRPRSAVIDDERRVHGVHVYNVRSSSSADDGGDNETDEFLREMVVAGLPELLYPVNGNNVLNLATLQRMHLFRHQAELIKKVAPLTKGEQTASGQHPLQDPGLEKALASYGNLETSGTRGRGKSLTQSLTHT